MPSDERPPCVIPTLVRLGRVALGGMLVLLTATGAVASEPSCPAGVRANLELPVTRAAITHAKTIKIVALGSSSTEGIGASAPNLTYPARLEALLHAGWPGVPITVQNKGVGGQTVDAVLDRLDSDVLAAKPTLVIWQVGTNEALRGMDPERFDALLDDGLRRLALAGSDIILMDYQIAPRMPADDKLAAYGSIIAKEAKAHSVSLFSRAALMRAWQINDPAASDMISQDGLHQSDRGYGCLAASLSMAIMTAGVPRVAVVNLNLK